MAPHQQTLEDPFVDMPAMPSPTRRGSRPPLNPFGLSAPLLKLQPPSPETSPHPPELLPPPVIHAGIAPGSHDPYSRADSPSSAIPLWTPDSPSAAHPNLPPPPSYDSPLSRTRTRSNEDPTAPSFASPFADTRSLHSLSSEGSAAASPPRRPEDRKFGSSSAKARGFVVLNGSTPSFLETGTAGKPSALSSEEAAARRRRNQKLKWGGMAGGLCLVLALLVSLAVGVGVGVVRS